MEEIIKMDIPDLNAVTQKYVYYLLRDGKVVYVGKCNFGLSFLHTHKSKKFDGARILVIPNGYDQDSYYEYLLDTYKPEYNLRTTYEKKDVVEFIKDEDLIALIKIRSILEKCDLEYKYTNTSTFYSRYIEYVFVKRHKMNKCKVGNRSYVSLSAFVKIMKNEHGIDVTRYIS